MSDWQPISSAPRDGTYILAIVAPNDSRHLGHQAGRVFVIKHEGKTARSGYDMGWAVYPGFGGVPDSYFSHWQPLPQPPATGSYGITDKWDTEPNPYWQAIDAALSHQTRHGE